MLVMDPSGLRLVCFQIERLKECFIYRILRCAFFVNKKTFKSAVQKYIRTFLDLPLYFPKLTKISDL